MKTENLRFMGVIAMVLFVSLAFLAILLSTMSAVEAASCSDNVLRVKKGALGAADGCSWDDAYPDLQMALAAAESGDQIWVVSGVYTPGVFVTDTFQLVDGVSLYGGFAATETVEVERDWQANPTVLSGDIDDNDKVDQDGVVTTTANIVGRNSYHVVTGNGLSRSTILDGFYITAGQSDEIGLDSTGGGMQNNFGDLALNDIIFIGNFGGGMENLESNPILTNVLFKNNLGRGGGGMSNIVSSPILTNVIFVSNTASNYGGGMHNAEGVPQLYNVAFIQNSARYEGGGMFNYYYASPVLENVIFRENSAWDGMCGGIANYFECSPVLTDVLFIGNTANLGGGMITFNEGNRNNVSMLNVSFLGNSAIVGGGLYNGGDAVKMMNVLFSGNNAEGEGGGVFSNGGFTEMNHVTFSGNVAGWLGGSMFNNYESNVSVNNSIFWNNQDSTGTGTITATSTISENSVVTLTNSLVQGSGGSDNWLTVSHVDGGGNIDSDPLFVEPIDLTTVPVSTGNLRLQFGSPAIDGGRNDMVPDGVTEDLNGKPRIINSIVDMGAYEALWFGIYLPLIVR